MSFNQKYPSEVQTTQHVYLNNMPIEDDLKAWNDDIQICMVF